MALFNEKGGGSNVYLLRNAMVLRTGSIFCGGPGEIASSQRYFSKVAVMRLWQVSMKGMRIL